MTQTVKYHHPNTSDGTDQEAWNNGTATRAGIDKLLEGGQAIVSPTKVGYIIMTTDSGGLEKKFDLKERPKRKPGVVLAKDNIHVQALAWTTSKIRELYAKAHERDILLGCILPWQLESYYSLVPNDCRTMVSDRRGTSCFVVRYGAPSEAIAHSLWEQHGRLAFASSANPSGKGNRGKLDGVGERILGGVDLIIEGNDFVAAQQPETDEGTRMEQGVMVSFVTDDGIFSDKPVIIRHGLALQPIRDLLTEVFGEYVDSHGSYY